MGPAGASVMDAARTAFVDAWQTTMWLSAGLAVAAAVFALVWTPGRRRERAQREAAAPSGAGAPAEGQPVVAAPAGVDT
jgi:predicted exporter